MYKEKAGKNKYSIKEELRAGIENIKKIKPIDFLYMTACFLVIAQLETWKNEIFSEDTTPESSQIFREIQGNTHKKIQKNIPDVRVYSFKWDD